MHSPSYLRADDFRFVQGADRRDRDDLIPGWSPDDRVVVVAPDPAADLAATAGLVLGLTHAFYDRPAAREPKFFDYPSHFVIGGEEGAEPRILSPGTQQPWSKAWCRLDVWPNTHHAVSDPSAESLLQAVFMLEPTRLVWPARLPVPEHYAPVETPVNPDQSDIRGILGSRLRQVVVYGESEPRDGESAAPEAWRVELTGSSRDLAAEAVGLLPSGPPQTPIASAAFRSVAVDEFL